MICAARGARIRVHGVRLVTAEFGAFIFDWNKACRDFILTCFQLHYCVDRLSCEVLLRMRFEYQMSTVWSWLRII